MQTTSKLKPQKALAILVSDIHLSHTAPISRSAELDWYAAMKRRLDNLRQWSVNMSDDPQKPLPVLYAGDIFHRWNPPNELVNFAIDNLPKGYAIPGQHDLPWHDMGSMDKSGYGTLVRAGVIKDVKPGEHFWDPETNLIIHGFPWGTPVTPLDREQFKTSKFWLKDIATHVVMIHAYVWSEGTGYPGVELSSHWTSWKKRLKGYDVALFGDNHKPFCELLGGIEVFNHGGFMPRDSDQINYIPHIGILMEDKRIQLASTSRVCKREKWLSPKELESVAMSATVGEFLSDLKEAGHIDLDFDEFLTNYLRTRDISKNARKILMRAIDAARTKIKK